MIFIFGALLTFVFLGAAITFVLKGLEGPDLGFTIIAASFGLITIFWGMFK